MTDDQKTLSQILEHLAALNQWTQSQDELHLKEQMDELTSLTRSLKSSAEALAKTAALTQQNEKTRAQEHAAALTKLSNLNEEQAALIERSKQERYKLEQRLHLSTTLNEKLSARSPLAATIQDNLKPIAVGSLISFLALLSLFVMMFLYIPKMNSGYTTMTTESFLTLDTEASHGRTWLHYLRNLPKEQADPLFSMVRSNHPPSSHALCLTTTPPSSNDESSSNSSSTNNDATEKSSKKSAKRKP